MRQLRVGHRPRLDGIRGTAGAARSDERGETLIELMVTVLVMGVAIVAILTAVLTMIRTSDIHRRSVRASNEAMSIAEGLDTAAVAYIACPTNTTYALPAGYTKPADVKYSITRKNLVSATSASPTYQAGCPGSEQGAQELTVTVWVGKGPRAVKEKVVIVKRRP